VQGSIPEIICLGTKQVTSGVSGLNLHLFTSKRDSEVNRGFHQTFRANPNTTPVILLLLLLCFPELDKQESFR
jgi:hypothetical protein